MKALYVILSLISVVAQAQDVACLDDGDQGKIKYYFGEDKLEQNMRLPRVSVNSFNLDTLGIPAYTNEQKLNVIGKVKSLVDQFRSLGFEVQSNIRPNVSFHAIKKQKGQTIEDLIQTASAGTLNPKNTEVVAHFLGMNRPLFNKLIRTFLVKDLKQGEDDNKIYQQAYADLASSNTETQAELINKFSLKIFNADDFTVLVPTMQSVVSIEVKNVGKHMERQVISKECSGGEVIYISSALANILDQTKDKNMRFYNSEIHTATIGQCTYRKAIVENLCLK